MEGSYSRINSIEGAYNFVQIQEAKFNIQIRNIVLDLMHCGEPSTKILTLSGPSCSGKTTTANKLTEQFKNFGYNAIMLSLDDFFLDASHTIGMDGSKVDFDSPSTIDYYMLERVARGINRRETVKLPKFDFQQRKPFMGGEYSPHSNDIIIFEGIQAVYPNTQYILSKYFDNYKSIFINVENNIDNTGINITSSDIRLLRRIIRDKRCRNASVEFTLGIWNSVRNNEEIHIFPNSKNCDFYINSFLEYEHYITAPAVHKEIEDIKGIDNLKELIAHVNNNYISKDLVPKQSVLREFIGEGE